MHPHIKPCGMPALSLCPAMLLEWFLWSVRRQASRQYRLVGLPVMQSLWLQCQPVRGSLQGNSQDHVHCAVHQPQTATEQRNDEC